MPKTIKWVDGPTRLLMSLLFLISGFGKLAGTAATQAYMQSFGVPGALVWPAAAWELGAGTLLLLGLWMRPVAFLLAGWCLLTALIFHTAFSDPEQMINFLKNLTMVGGSIISRTRVANASAGNTAVIEYLVTAYCLNFNSNHQLDYAARRRAMMTFAGRAQTAVAR